MSVSDFGKSTKAWKMDNSVLATKDITYKYIVVEKKVEENVRTVKKKSAGKNRLGKYQTVCGDDPVDPKRGWISYFV